MNKTLIHSTGFEIKTTKMVLWETQAGSFTMAEMKLLIDYCLPQLSMKRKISSTLHLFNKRQTDHYQTVRDFYSPENFFTYVSWYKKAAEKIKTLKFDVGYIEMCSSQPVQLLTQLLRRSLAYAAVLQRTSTYTVYRLIAHVTCSTCYLRIRTHLR